MANGNGDLAKRRKKMQDTAAAMAKNAPDPHLQEQLNRNRHTSGEESDADKLARVKDASTLLSTFGRQPKMRGDYTK